MENENTTNNISVGQNVEINPREDRTRLKRVSGIVAEVLTKNMNHPHGILVKLETGEVGRIKTQSTQEPYKTETSSKKQNTTIGSLISAGETHQIEYKTDALWSANYTAEDIKNHRPQSKELHTYGKTTSKIIIAKTLAAFLNSDGGNLIIGFKEGKNGQEDEVVGIEPELTKLKDASIDGYRRMLLELIKDYFPATIFNQFNQNFFIDFENMETKTLCRIEVNRSSKRTFLKLKGKDHFFVRIDASTRELTGEAVVDYCESRFG